jgi:hypothetical protein
MDVHEMRKWTRRDPFVPFQIRCHDEAVYRIPALGLASAAGREVVVGIPNQRNLARYIEFVDYTRIAAVEPLEVVPAAGSA